MKKNKQQNELLEGLRKINNISSVCSGLGLSRTSVYRWREEDPEFARMMDEALALGQLSICDLAESYLVLAVKAGEPWAIKYWLDNNKFNYIKPRTKGFTDSFSTEDQRVTKIELEIHGPRESPNFLSVKNQEVEGPNVSVQVGPHTPPND